MIAMNCLYTIVSMLHLVAMSGAYFYCSDKLLKTLCTKDNQKYGHIVCNSDQMPDEAVFKFETYYPRTRKMIRLLLDLHNECRNKVASGAIDNQMKKFFYPPAVRMRELIWDWELSYVSAHNIQKCSFAHDKCRNTVAYPICGQNLALLETGAKNIKKYTMEYIIRDSMYYWFIEANYTWGIGIVDKFRNEKPASGEEISHFTTLVNDQISRVGCSMARCKVPNKPHKDTKWRFLLACNYDFTNVRDHPMYNKGFEPATRCIQWGTSPSKRYANLCQNSGRIFPKMWDKDFQVELGVDDFDT